MPIRYFLQNKTVPLKNAKILVVDDKPINIQAINAILSQDYVVFAATSGEEALEFCYDNTPDLILMDVIMPGMGGLEACKRLKQQEATSRIPVIFVSNFDQQQDEDACWAAGAIDFITKPVNPVTLKNRVKAHLTLKFQNDILADLAYIDGLTGVFNRRYLDAHLEQLTQQSARTGRDLGILFLDIDYFKQYNDHYGHIKGDETLNAVAQLLSKNVHRPTDFVARYGGEEFAVILPDTDLQGAYNIAEQIQQAIEEAAIAHAGSSFQTITLSIGCTTLNESKKHNKSLLDCADQLLYQAKSSGRNVIICRGSPRIVAKAQ